MADFNPILEEKVSKQLLRMTIDTSFGLFSVLLFNLVDTLFIAKLGVEELAAFSFVPPIVFCLSSLTLGVGIGVSVVISNYMGSNESQLCPQINTYGILLSLLITSLFAFVGILLLRPTFLFLGAKGIILFYIQEYMYLWYISFPLTVIPIIANATLRGLGETKLPAIYMICTALINLLLDYLLIFGYKSIPSLGIKGAAYATFITRIFSNLLFLYTISSKYKLLSFRNCSVNFVLKIWTKILNIGIASGGNRVISPLISILVIKIIASHGKEVTAAYGLVNRIESFSLLLITSLSVVIAPFIGQNMNAQKIDRVMQSISYCKKFCLIWSIFNAIFLVFFGESIIKLSNNDINVIDLSTKYLYIVSLSLLGVSLLYISNSICNPLGKPYIAIKLTLTRMGLLYLPLIYIGDIVGGFTGILGGIFLANTVIGILSNHEINKMKAMIYQFEN